MDKCVGCGLCCILSQCSLSIDLYGEIGKCPELKWKQNRYVCNLYLKNKEIGRKLGIDKGCPLERNRWRQNVKKRKREELFTNEPLFDFKKILY